MKLVAFDNTMLSILLNPESKIPLDPTTNLPVTFAKERASHLVSSLSKTRTKVIIPAPACAELLTVIGPDAQQYLDIVSQTRFFEIVSFDNKCAIELAMLNRTVFLDQDKKNKVEPYQKIKLDRQIIAICKASGVLEIYSDDSGVAARAALCGMTAIPTCSLPPPPSDAQMKLKLEKLEELPEAPREVET